MTIIGIFRTYLIENGEINNSLIQSLPEYSERRLRYPFFANTLWLYPFK